MHKNFDIEALRGLAVAITFAAHLDTLWPSWQPALWKFWLGGGVELFFAISGLLITRQLLRMRQPGQAFLPYAGNFWLRRAFRLWPAALFCSTAYLLFALTVQRDLDAAFTAALPWNWLFSSLHLQNLYIHHCATVGPACVATPLWHYWTLSLEEQFYLLIPVLVFCLGQRRWLIAVLLAWALWQSGTVRPWGGLLWFLRTDALCYGVVIALLAHHHPGVLERCRAALPRGAVQALLVSLLVVLVVGAQPTRWAYYMGTTAVCAGLIVLLVSGNQGLLTSRPGLRRWAAYAGSRSYGLYLYHMPVLAIVHYHLVRDGRWLQAERGSDQLLGLALAVLLTMALAELSYRCLEQPLRRYGAAVAERWSMRRATPSGRWARS